MNKALKSGHLFTFVDEKLKGLGIHATTNMIEGAVKRLNALLINE